MNDQEFRRWARRPFWKFEEAALLLLGKEPKLGALETDGEAALLAGRIRNAATGYGGAVSAENRLLPFLSHPNHGNVVRPVDVVGWAEAEGIQVPHALSEYDYAAGSRETFDEDSDTYPRELDIAMQAWRAAVTASSDKAPKGRIIAWLNKTYPGKKLPSNARERIATVANWNKRGGTPKGNG